MSKKVYIVRSNSDYHNLMVGAGFEVTYDPTKANLALFTGGADVSPALYGAKQHMHTFAEPFRDTQEQQFFKTFQENGIPCVGICRGGQFLNVMSGGEMYQHVTKHCGDHHITDLETGESIFVSSTHHQMMKPSLDAILVASAGLHGEREWYEGVVLKKDVSNEDIEVVFYPHTNCLCFQPHPEFTGKQYVRMREYFISLVNKYFFEEVGV